jgi:hypothetical protein
MHTERRRISNAVLAIAASAATVLASVPAEAQAAAGDTHADMHSTTAHPNAHGEVRYESRTGEREFDLYIRGIHELAGKRLTVHAHGALVGHMQVSPRGRAHLYQDTSVPVMHRHDSIKVRTPSGMLVTTGTLRRHHTGDHHDTDNHPGDHHDGDNHDGDTHDGDNHDGDGPSGDTHDGDGPSGDTHHNLM